MSRFNDIREPIEYVVNQYFEKKRTLSSNTDDDFIPSDGSYIDDNLPEYPLTIIRDGEGKAYKFVYGDVESLLEDEEASPIIWQEELVRENGIVVSIITTYPDGESVENEFIREDGKLVEIT